MLNNSDKQAKPWHIITANHITITKLDDIGKLLSAAMSLGVKHFRVLNIMINNIENTL
jgi:hypothetical protein